MTTTHGVEVNEVPTGVRPAVRTTAGLPVYIGTAPVSAGDITAVNKPVVCYSLAEAEESFGALVESSHWDKWTLHEAISAHFSVYRVGPIVLINVIDPDNADHVASAAGEVHLLDSDGEVQIEQYPAGAPVYGVIKSSVVVKKAGVTMTLDTDYSLSFDDDGYCVVTALDDGALAAGDTITVDFDYLDPGGVTSANIIGGYNSSTGVYTGIEVADQVYPSLRLVPGFLLAPMWSQEPTVAAALASKASLVSGAFRAHALVDLPTDGYDIVTYADAGAWKADNGFNVDDVTPCWPRFKNGSDVYHLSTITACIANKVDEARGGIPYASPSNQAITGTACVVDDGTEVLLTEAQANALNAQGIVTARNTFSGWKLWGNRTGVYPGNTDPKDAFIPIRRMFNYVKNTTILTVERDVDQPGNRRLIDGVLGTLGSFINGLIAVGALVDGLIEFRPDKNTTTEMADGHYVFHYTLTPPSPAQRLEFTVEYDPDALKALFA